MTTPTTSAIVQAINKTGMATAEASPKNRIDITLPNHNYRFAWVSTGFPKCTVEYFEYNQYGTRLARVSIEYPPARWNVDNIVSKLVERLPQ